MKPPFASYNARAACALILLAAASPTLAADEPRTSPAVSVVQARKACFADTIEATGVLVPKQEILVRPDREGLQISQVLVEAGDAVSAGQVLARLGQPDGQGTAIALQAPAAGIIRKVSATVGTVASARAEPLFQIIAQGEIELQAEVATQNLVRLSVGQKADIKIVGGGEAVGRVRLISSSIDPTTQLGQVWVTVTDAAQLRVGTYARASIVAGQSCGIAIPLSALLYGREGAVVQAVRGDRIETRGVVVGLFSERDAEIREGLAAGDLVVARAGAFLREGDRVRPIAVESGGRN